MKQRYQLLDDKFKSLVATVEGLVAKNRTLEERTIVLEQKAAAYETEPKQNKKKKGVRTAPNANLVVSSSSNPSRVSHPDVFSIESCPRRYRQARHHPALHHHLAQENAQTIHGT